MCRSSFFKTPLSKLPRFLAGGGGGIRPRIAAILFRASQNTSRSWTAPRRATHILRSFESLRKVHRHLAPPPQLLAALESAEGEGFEPSKVLSLLDFESSAFDLSATPPYAIVRIPRPGFFPYVTRRPAVDI
jgi:hypothetical protein